MSWADVVLLVVAVSGWVGAYYWMVSARGWERAHDMMKHAHDLIRANYEYAKSGHSKDFLVKIEKLREEGKRFDR